MHIAIDILAGVILLFFFLSGWHRGFLLSLLGVLRVVLSYGIAYASGRWLGVWLGGATRLPRLVAIPACAILAFLLVAFAFRTAMRGIHAHHREKEKEDRFHLPPLSCLSGGAISLAGGALSLVLLFWLGDLFLVGVAGTSIPGANEAWFGRVARRTIYEAAYRTIPKKDNAPQVAAMARMISNPAQSMAHLENVLAAESVQQMLADKQFAADMLSGDAARIQQNASCQRVFNDRATREELQELGILSGYETQSGICERLATFGRNEKIRSCIDNLKAKRLLSTDQIPALVRDPDFDTILCELLK